jgi:putative ABC transport system ATP-binding protein
MIVEIDNLVKKFDDASKVIDINRFTLADNEIISIFGRSGCGKTTLLNIIAGVLGGYEGGVNVCGVKLNSLNEKELDSFRAKNIGYVFQNFNLLQGYSAYENIELSLRIAGYKYRDGEIMEYFEKTGLINEARKYPSQLSLGQQQRVAVLRAVIKKPPLILADEPTSSLDSINSDAIIGLLKKCASEAGSALITVSHEKEVICAFDKNIDFNDINCRTHVKAGGTK